MGSKRWKRNLYMLVEIPSYDGWHSNAPYDRNRYDSSSYYWEITFSSWKGIYLEKVANEGLTQNTPATQIPTRGYQGARGLQASARYSCQVNHKHPRNLSPQQNYTRDHQRLREDDALVLSLSFRYGRYSSFIHTSTFLHLTRISLPTGWFYPKK